MTFCIAHGVTIAMNANEMAAVDREVDSQTIRCSRICSIEKIKQCFTYPILVIAHYYTIVVYVIIVHYILLLVVVAGGVLTYSGINTSYFHVCKKKPVDFDDELKIGDVRYVNIIKITIKVQLF